MDFFKTDIGESLHHRGAKSYMKDLDFTLKVMYTSPTLLQLLCNLFYLTIARDYTYLLGHKLINEWVSFIFLQEDLSFLFIGFLLRSRFDLYFVLRLVLLEFVSYFGSYLSVCSNSGYCSMFE